MNNQINLLKELYKDSFDMFFSNFRFNSKKTKLYYDPPMTFLMKPKIKNITKKPIIILELE